MSPATRFKRDYRREIPGGYEIVYEYEYYPPRPQIIGVEFLDPIGLDTSGRLHGNIYYYYDPGRSGFKRGDIVTIPTMYDPDSRAIVREVDCDDKRKYARNRNITMLLRRN